MWEVTAMPGGQFLALGSGVSFIFNDIELIHSDGGSLICVTFILNGMATGSICPRIAEQVLGGYITLTDERYMEVKK